MSLDNGQGEVAHLAGEQPLPVAVAMGGALIGAALMELSAREGRNLGFQQVLETPAHDLWSLLVRVLLLQRLQRL